MTWQQEIDLAAEAYGEEVREKVRAEMQLAIDKQAAELAEAYKQLAELQSVIAQLQSQQSQ